MESSRVTDRLPHRLWRLVPALILAAVSAGLGAGGLAWAAGWHDLADAAWAATAAVALIPIALGIVRDLLRRHAGVDIVAVLAMAGALALGEYLAGAIIAVMYAGGRYIEDYAAGRAERDLATLVQRAPRFANRVQEGGHVETVPVDTVSRGDLLVVRTGDIVPVDGLVVEDVAVLDESSLTGEAKPVSHSAGDRVGSGTTNVGPPFQMRAVATAGQSAYAGIIKLVREAREAKAPFARLADRYALLFVPVALGVAGAAWWASGDPVRALAVLVVATPCPLLLGAPIAIVSGLSRAARRGVVMKGGAALEALARSQVVFLDKTGTVTVGTPTVAQVLPFEEIETAELLRLAASLEQVSPHVLAEAIVRAGLEQRLSLSFPSQVEEVAGTGVRGRVDGHEVALGAAEWVIPGGRWDDAEHSAFQRRVLRDAGSVVYVSVDGALAGALVLDDPVRPEAARTVRTLRQGGVRRVYMASGDHPLIADAVGAALGVDRVYAQLTPDMKVAAVQEARSEGMTVMVGDGINDAPALATADVGIAMGARGASASSEAADVVITVDRLDRLVDAREISARSRRIAIQSVTVGMGLSFAAMGVAAFGYLPPVAGAILQEGIDVLAIGIALRALAGPTPISARAILEPELSRRLREEHDTLIPALEMLRETADALDDAEPKAAAGRLQDAERFLSEVVIPHEQADEVDRYPGIARALEGTDPLGAMSRVHREIFELTAKYQRQVEALPAAGPAPADLVELRRLLYSLHALLRLHCDQEEELYQALDDGYRPQAGPVAAVLGNQ